MDTPELFREVTEATADLAASASTIAVAVESARLKLPVCGQDIAAKAVLILDRNAKGCSDATVVVALKVALVAAAVVEVVADSIKAASDTLLADADVVADAVVAAASEAMAATDQVVVAVAVAAAAVV